MGDAHTQTMGGTKIDDMMSAQLAQELSLRVTQDNRVPKEDVDELLFENEILLPGPNENKVIAFSDGPSHESKPNMFGEVLKDEESE